MVTSKTYLKVGLSALIAVLLIGISSEQALSQNNSDVVKVESPGSVEETVDKLSKMVSSNDMMVMGELNQGNALSMTGMSVKSQSIFVGNPQVGKKLFSADAGAGVAVPIRINIFEDTDGQTWVTYIPPSNLLSGLDNPKIDKIAQMLDKKLQKMTSML